VIHFVVDLLIFKEILCALACVIDFDVRLLLTNSVDVSWAKSNVLKLIKLTN
jgi:hypothetical protein